MNVLSALASANIRTLIEHKGGGNQSAAARLTGVPQRTIGRILNCEVDVSLSILNRIANAYGYNAWQLLVPGFNPATPPQLSSDSHEERRLLGNVIDAILAYVENKKN